MTQVIEAALARARVARAAGRADEAREEYDKAAKRARVISDAGQLAYALRHISDLARDAGEPDAALAAACEAVMLYRRRGDGALDLANALRLTALALEALGRKPEARPVWAEARGLYAEAGVSAGVVECEAGMGK